MEYPHGLLFEEDLQKELKEKFYYADEDPEYGERLFFENSGGSLRLKKCVEAKEKTERFPDCPERIHERSLNLKSMVDNGTKEILEIIFGAKEGSLITELTASQTMFHMVGLIMENIPGKNAVVSSLEHPSAFDAVEFYCKKTGKEMRVVPANKKTGGIIAEFAGSDIQVIDGSYGPYIKHAGSNYKLPKGTDATTLTEEQCKEIIASSEPTGRKKRRK